MKEAIKHIEGEITNLGFRIRNTKVHLKNCKMSIIEVELNLTSLIMEKESFKKALLKLRK